MSKEKKQQTNKDEKTSKEPSQELEKLKDQYNRLLAEYANYKRRTDEEKSRLYDMGASDVLSGVVKVLDDFELALNNAQDLESFKKGMEMIFANIVSTGEEFGLERIKTVGEPFDPTKHEALLAEESDQAPQTIITELQSGYMVKDKVIRTAKVKVSR